MEYIDHMFVRLLKDYIHNNMDTLRLVYTSYNLLLDAQASKSNTAHIQHSMMQSLHMFRTAPPDTSAPRRAKRTKSESTHASATYHTHDTRLYQEFNNMYYETIFF